MVNELDTVILAAELPARSLKAGDLGTVVLVHRHGGYKVEFTTLDGETVAVVSLSPDQVRPVGRREIAHECRRGLDEESDFSIIGVDDA